eukprot:scaffold1569_cov171-Amphora_coffeaeformis.AAC.11
MMSGWLHVPNVFRRNRTKRRHDSVLALVKPCSKCCYGRTDGAPKTTSQPTYHTIHDKAVGGTAQSKLADFPLHRQF